MTLIFFIIIVTTLLFLLFNHVSDIITMPKLLLFYIGKFYILFLLYIHHIQLYWVNNKV